MARAATVSDVFNAVAEPRRRAILDFLAVCERTVNEVVRGLKMDQPSVSKHLRVLREVGLVRVRKEGRARRYAVDGEKLKPIHDWTRTYERYWTRQLDRIKARAEDQAAAAGTSSATASGESDQSTDRETR
jgi:DNA-binding transcriptional ArsR family regulator